jgi:hypothetical protein
MSKHDHDEYVRLNASSTRAFWADELPPETLQALVESRMDPRHDELNALLDD